jgi:hypothetical protein
MRGDPLFHGSPNQLIALIIQDVLDAVQRKRLEVE